MIINPGSRIGSPGEGWTNTVEVARRSAEDWLREMHKDGMCDVVLLPGEEEHDGRWYFRFRHEVTGVEVELGIHGIDDVNAYERQRIFTPRTYWRGSSSANPKIEDFAAPGYVVWKTFREEES